MKRSELDSGHVESAVGVVRTLVHYFANHAEEGGGETLAETGEN